MYVKQILAQQCFPSCFKRATNLNIQNVKMSYWVLGHAPQSWNRMEYHYTMFVFAVHGYYFFNSARFGIFMRV